LSELPKITDKQPKPAAPPADECGRGRGRTPEGECVTLNLKDTEFVQRVQIPGGDFVMGGLPDDYNGTLTREAPAVRQSGQPPRPANLPSFWIDLHEVTRDAYDACVRDGACTPSVCPEGQVDPAVAQDLSAEIRGVLPQTCVTHTQAAAYCKHVGARLPREAEWEYAARGVDARIFPWGNEIQDQIPNAIYPAGHVREDSSYFGIRGLGSNVAEWVDEVYDADAGLRPFLRGEFRGPDSPVLRAPGFERKAACGDDTTASAPRSPRLRHVSNTPTPACARAAATATRSHFPGFELEGWMITGRGPKVGFRCVADLAPGDVPLRVPAPALPVPLVRLEGKYQIFGGVAEAVTQDEARRFCANLEVPDGTGGALLGWRLPSQLEMPTSPPASAARARSGPRRARSCSSPRRARCPTTRPGRTTRPSRPARCWPAACASKCEQATTPPRARPDA
jgi:formylglycine-generating enzyme required for sulfatase activity